MRHRLRAGSRVRTSSTRAYHVIMPLVSSQFLLALAQALLPLAFLSMTLACSTSADVKAQTILLDQYAAAVRANNPVEAYALLSQDQRRNISMDAFKRSWKSVHPELKERALTLTGKHALPHRVQARVVAPTGLDFLLVQENGQWRISRGYPGSTRSATPEETLRAFILAVEQEDLQGAMQLLSPETRLRLQTELKDRVKSIREALKGGIQVTDGRAQLRYGARRKIRLVKEKEQWWIQELD